jgi:hypothetical protein
MELNNESWLPWLLKVVGAFGFFAVVAALALGIAGLVLCFTGGSRKTFLIYLLLAQLPILLCVVGALRNWLLVNMVIQRTDVLLKASEWAEIRKEIWTMVLWGVGWSIPIDILGLVGLSLRRRKSPVPTLTP